MYFIEMIQGDRRHSVGLFESERDVIDWLESIPYVDKETYGEEFGSLTSYTMSYDRIPLYDEIEWKGSRFPMTKMMFTPDEGDVLFVWQDLSLFGQEKGLVKGVTQVDAYVVPNEDAKQYIALREEVREAVLQHYKERSIDVYTGGLGSEDGEYVHAPGYTFLHLDPYTVSMWEEKESVEAFFNEVVEEK